VCVCRNKMYGKYQGLKFDPIVALCRLYEKCDIHTKDGTRFMDDKPCNQCMGRNRFIRTTIYMNIHPFILIVPPRFFQALNPNQGCFPTSTLEYIVMLLAVTEYFHALFNNKQKMFEDNNDWHTDAFDDRQRCNDIWVNEYNKLKVTLGLLEDSPPKERTALQVIQEFEKLMCIGNGLCSMTQREYQNRPQGVNWNTEATTLFEKRGTTRLFPWTVQRCKEDALKLRLNRLDEWNKYSNHVFGEMFIRDDGGDGGGGNEEEEQVVVVKEEEEQQQVVVKEEEEQQQVVEEEYVCVVDV